MEEVYNFGSFKFWCIAFALLIGCDRENLSAEL